MRVRIRKVIGQNNDLWLVEVKKNFLYKWNIVDWYYGDNAYMRALECANRWKNPTIIEIGDFE